MIMTIEVMRYGYEWTEHKKKLPWVQEWICILMICERVIAILLRLHYLHKYLELTPKQRFREKIAQFVTKGAINILILVFYFSDNIFGTLKVSEYSVLVRFWLYFQILSIAVDPLIINVFMPWLRKADDEKVEDAKDKFHRESQAAGETKVEMVEAQTEET